MAAIMKERPVGRRFSLDLTKLTGTNILTENRDRDLDYLDLLDIDRMLYNFRKTFGEDTKGAEPLGGWDSPDGLLRGHSTGHFLSALAFAYAGDHNPERGARLNAVVAELRRLQMRSKGRARDFVTQCTKEDTAQEKWSRDPSTWGEGFISAYSPDQFALLEQMTPYASIWAPYYTLHKLLKGLLDAYLLAGNKEALEAAEGIAEWVYDRLSAVPDEKREAMWSLYIAGEYGGMNESLAALYRITGNENHLKAAKLFDNKPFFDGLAEGKDTVHGLHANQHIPQILGALQEYKATGDPWYFRIAKNFWEIVTRHYAYAIGGVGRNEKFTEADALAENIEADRNCETCCAYNMLKLTQELYRYEPDHAEYMDYYERTLLNQIAASQNPTVLPDRHHGVTYMLPIGPGARREYSNDYAEFTCCHGTGMENHVKYQENIFYQTDEAIYVNLYIPSRLTLKEDRYLTLDGDFPGEQMTLVSDYALTVRLRVPSWCKDSFFVEQAGSFIASTEAYMSVDLLPGEPIVIHLPYKLHLSRTKDDPSLTAVLFGPLVMAALDERTEYLELCEDKLTPSWGTFREKRMPLVTHEDLLLVPMYAAHDTAYHTYMKITPTAEKG